MDEQAGRPGNDPSSDEDEHEQPANADRLVARLAELRGYVEILAPQDQERGREAIERIREAQERIATLDAMLVAAREREHELTVQLIRNRGQLAEYEARISELTTIATRVETAEEASRDAEVAAAEQARAAEIAQADMATLRAESEQLRSRCAELEADLSGVADELAAAAIARTEGARLERERNEARERAHTERKLAAADRIRAAEAELRASELQTQLRNAERRIVQLANAARAEASTPSAETDEHPARPAPPEPPWLELQRTSAGSGEPTNAEKPESIERANDLSVEESDVIDLTAQADGDSSSDEVSTATNASDRSKDEGWAASADESFFGRLRHQRRKE